MGEAAIKAASPLVLASSYSFPLYAFVLADHWTGQPWSPGDHRRIPQREVCVVRVWHVRALSLLLDADCARNPAKRTLPCFRHSNGGTG